MGGGTGAGFSLVVAFSDYFMEIACDEEEVSTPRSMNSHCAYTWLCEARNRSLRQAACMSCHVILPFIQFYPTPILRSYIPARPCWPPSAASPRYSRPPSPPSPRCRPSFLATPSRTSAATNPPAAAPPPPLPPPTRQSGTPPYRHARGSSDPVPSRSSQPTTTGCHRRQARDPDGG